MKKTLFITIAALSLAACTVEMVPEVDNPQEASNVLSFKAIMVNEGATKAEVDITTGVCGWKSGDQIAIHTKNGNLALFSTTESGSEATFTLEGALADGDEILENAIAYYPATIAIAGDATKVKMPRKYNNAEESAQSFTLRGIRTGGAINFKQLGALLKLTIKDIPSDVDSLRLETGTNALSYTLNVDITDASAPICQIGATQANADRGKIAIATAGHTDGENVFIIPLPVGTITGGFSIKLIDKDAVEPVVSTKSTSSDFSVPRLKIIKMKAYTPEGAASEWCISGGFNSWNTSANPMTEVLGHSGWLVCRNVNTAHVDGQADGFKFQHANSDWTGGSGTSLHTSHSVTIGSGSNIVPAEGVYDIYFNPTGNKYFIANAGECWNREIYLMTDMTLSDGTYYFHAWPHGGSGDITSSWPGNSGTTETISGIKYYKFQVGIDNSPAGSYDCVFHTSDDAIRYDFRDGKLVINDNDSSFYLSFTGNTYNAAIEEGNTNATYGNSTTNPMTQFTDPENPQGDSNWNVYVDGRKPMHWENGELVAHSITIGPATEVRFLFANDWYHYCGLASSGTVVPDTEFSVVVENGDNAHTFTIPSLDDTYLCDVYLNTFDNTARVVPQAKADAKVTTYFAVPNPGTYVNLYYFGKGDNGWPGKAMTYAETINGIDYYKFVFDGAFLWNSSVKIIIVSDGISSDQTHDFEDGDWSGYKDEYWFNIQGRDISQLRGRPVFPSSINGNFSDWLDLSGNSYTSGSTGHTTIMKGYSDGTDLWLYLKLTPGAGTYTLESWRYFRLYFDRDNNSATGSDNWFYGGADDISSGINNILVYFSKSGDVDKAVIRNQGDSENISGASIVVVNNGAAGIETELKIPLSEIGSITGNLINVFAVGTCGSEFDGKIMSVYVPTLP